MNKPIKAALLSALVFPGCGHFFLKKNVTGAILSVITIGCLVEIVRLAIDIANTLSNKIINGQIALDAGAISQAITASLDSANNLPLSISTWLMLACWIIGIIDSYRVAKNIQG